MAHVRPQHGDERFISRIGKCMGLERRQLPNLSVPRERIGRRAEGDAGGVVIGVRPDLAAVPRGAQRKIAIDAELETGRARAISSGGELPLGDPLQPDVEIRRRVVRRCRLSPPCAS